MRLRSLTLAALASLSLACSLRAEPLSKKFDIDFYREVLSRNLKGLATRADGRLVAGPALNELTGTAPAELLWCLAPGADGKWLLGTGPDGRIFEATLDLAKNSYATTELLKLDDPQVFALARLSDGTILAGTSPKGGLYLIREGKVVARVGLPVDSIFDILVLPDSRTALIATGNPGRVYKVDLTKLAAAGIVADKLTDAKILGERGLTLFGEIRDRNARRLARLTDGRIVLGSAPKGNIYGFAAEGGAPVILQENRDAEVTDLLPQPNGDFIACVVFSSTGGESRITAGSSSSKSSSSSNSSAPPKDSALAVLELPPPVTNERFSGRSTLTLFPANGFPEILATRANASLYRLARHGDTLVAAGGEQGEIVGYDFVNRLALTFSGSASSQLNSLAAVPGSPDKFLILRNNAPGFAVLDFAATAPREAETRRLDLGPPALLGALRFNRIRELDTKKLTLEVKTSNGTDDLEGWSAWTPLAPDDDAWRAANLRGRYVKLRLRLPADTTAATELDKPSLAYLSQNRRPALAEFRFITPGFGLIPAVDSPPPSSVSLSQLLSGGAKDDEPKHKGNFTSSQVVPSPGAQVAFWTVNDPDGDNVVCTFSIRRDSEKTWTDLTVATRDPYVQFDTSHLPDGVYFTRLVATETAPRSEADRLSVTFETDDLIVDHTPPTIVEATAKPAAGKLVISVHGRDALSLLDSMEVTLNNGVHEVVDQPADGIRDGREETFVLELPLARTAGATAAEVTLYDAAGNPTVRRLTW